MTVGRIGALAVLAGAILPQTAWACSCAPINDAGFIHAGVGQLPSNARGALFLQPADSAASLVRIDGERYIYRGVPRLLPRSAFVITSDADQGPLPVEITALTLPGAAEGMATTQAFKFAHAADLAQFGDGSREMDGNAMLRAGRLIDISADMAAAPSLVRVGPVGGFKPGVKYTITYKGKSEQWLYPATVQHVIDKLPLDTAGPAYALVMDGPSQRRPIVTPEGGSCAGWTPAIVQDFHYVVPNSQKRYPKAIMYISAVRDDKVANARFDRLVYRPDNCSSPELGATARGNGAELVFEQCGPAPGKVSVRGWAGVLEVEDRLRPTAIAQVDFAKATGRSCAPFSMLKEALASRNQQRIEETLCAAPRLREGDVLPADLPAMTDLLAQATSGSSVAKGCAKGALSALVVAAPAYSKAYLEQVGKVLGAEIASPDKKVADAAWEPIYRLVNHMYETERREPNAPSGITALLRPMLPLLFKKLTTGTPEQAESAGFYIASLGGHAKSLGPALLAIAESGATAAGPAAHALTGIMPGDPRLHRILLRNAAIPSLRERAALDYNQVAGAIAFDKAVALLSEAARHGSEQAAGQLGLYGVKARAGAPGLIAMMERGAGKGHAALDALLLVTDAEPEVMAAFGKAIAAGPDGEMYDFTLEKLTQLKRKGRPLLPAIEKRMTRPMSADRKAVLGKLISSMELPRAQAQRALRRLARVKIVADH